MELPAGPNEPLHGCMEGWKRGQGRVSSGSGVGIDEGRGMGRMWGCREKLQPSAVCLVAVNKHGTHHAKVKEGALRRKCRGGVIRGDNGVGGACTCICNCCDLDGIKHCMGSMHDT